MRRNTLLTVASIMLGLLAVAGRAADSPRTARPDPRLDKETTAADQATVDRAIAELKEVDSAKREQAAATLRRLVAKYPSHTVYLATDDGGRAAWQKKIARIKVGMTRAEVQKIAPPFHAGVGGAFGGRNFFEFYTLDYHWKLNISYTGMIGKDDTTTVLAPPGLIEQVMEVFMPGPPGLTGVWTTWYVTGEKARDVQYAAGQPHGVETWFYPNGHKCEEDHYVRGVRTGAHTSWRSDGTLQSSYFYVDDKPHGACADFYPNGKKERETNFDHGQQEGRETTWYEDGRVESIADYHQDRLHGLSAQWDKNGKLEFEDHYENGKRVP